MIANSTVGIKKIEYINSKTEIKNKLFELLEEMKCNGKINIPVNSNIMIKVNICMVKGPETGTSVDPFIIKCLCEWLFRNYSIESITIGEADASALNVDIAFKVLGWEEMFSSGDNNNIHLLNLSKDDRKSISLNGKIFKELSMSKSYMDANFLISVGKLKTHSLTGMTCILKNQFGSNPIKNKMQYHSKLAEVIFDLNRVRLPDLCLVDGIIAMEGLGPTLGIPKPLGLIVAGDDAVATDIVCAEIMGFNPKDVPYLRLAIEEKLGNNKYDLFGEKVQNVKTTFITNPKWKSLIAKFYKNSYFRKCFILKRFL